MVDWSVTSTLVSSVLGNFSLLGSTHDLQALLPMYLASLLVLPSTQGRVHTLLLDKQHKTLNHFCGSLFFFPPIFTATTHWHVRLRDDHLQYKKGIRYYQSYYYNNFIYNSYSHPPTYF